MQYIQLQPQVASQVPFPAIGNLNLFLDNADNIVKVVDDNGTIYGPTGGTGTGIYVTGMTFNVSNYDLSLIRNDNSIDTQSLSVLATSMTVTGGTYFPNTGTGRFTDNSGSSFDVQGFLTGYTDIYITGMTFNTSNYDLTISRSDGWSETRSLSILSSDMTITGGTYNPNNGVGTFTNNSGGTFNVTGFLTGYTDVITTGGTYDSNTGIATFNNTDGNTFNVTGFYTGSDALTGGTYDSNTGIATFTNTTGNNVQITGFTTGGGTPLITIPFTSITGDTLMINPNDTLLINGNPDLLLAMQNNSLIPGQFYKITGVNVDLYGGTDIIVQALSTNTISKNGHGLFYNPKYTQYDIWSPYSTLEFTSQDGFFEAGEKILGDSGQTGTLVGLPGNYQLTFIAETGEFSAGTVVTGYNSGATALTTNLVSASYNIDDKVIWGGKVWKNVSGNSVTLVDKVIGTGDAGYWQYPQLPAGINLDTFSITCNGETLTGQTGNCYNIHGDAGGYACYDVNSGYIYVHFETGSVEGFDILASYTVGINQRQDSWTLSEAWEVVPYDDVDYVPTWDIIEYEYNYDNISFRKDADNEVSSAWAVSVDYWGWNSIKGMQWGGRVYQLTAKNPYLENLVNFNGNNVDRVTIGENGSMDCNNWNTGINIGDIFINDNGWLQFNAIGIDNYIQKINIGTNSNVYGITLANNDDDDMYFGDINLGNSADDCGTYIEDIIVGANCRFYGINLDSAGTDSCTYINYISLNNNSRVFNVKIDQGGYIDNLNLYNDAQANNIQIGQGAYIEDGYIYNGGQLHSIILEGGTFGYLQNYQGNWSPSNLYDFSIGTSSYMHDIKIGLGSVIENIYLDNVTGISGNYFHYISLNNNSTIRDVYFNGSSSFFGDGSFGFNSYIQNITLSGSSYFTDNTIGDGVDINDVILQDNTEFYNNTLLNGTSFDGMYLTSCVVIDNIFKGGNVNDNYIYNNFYNNEIGMGFTGNHISGETYNNIIGEQFEYNTIYGSFYDNQIFNEFKSNITYQSFYYNRTDWGFGSNQISGSCSYNSFGPNIYTNDFLGSVYANTFKGGVGGNTIGDNFSTNNIGFGFSNNVIGENFGYGYSAPQGNIIGNGFIENTVGEYFYNNTIADNFVYNTIDNHFQWNIVNTAVSGVCLSTGMLYDITTVNVFKNKNGDNRLSYYDESDVLTVETLTEAPCVGGLNALDIPENDLNFGLVL
jgi:hypothetical protein